MVRPSLHLGVDWCDDPSVRVASGMLANAETVAADDLIGRVSLALDVFADQDTTLGVSYNGAFGGDTIAHGGQTRPQLDF